MQSEWAILEERKFIFFCAPTSVSDVFAVELAFSFYACVIGLVMTPLAETHLCGMIGILCIHPLSDATGWLVIDRYRPEAEIHASVSYLESVVNQILPYIHVGLDDENRCIVVVEDYELFDFIEDFLGEECDLPYEYRTSKERPGGEVITMYFPLDVTPAVIK